MKFLKDVSSHHQIATSGYAINRSQSCQTGRVTALPSARPPPSDPDTSNSKDPAGQQRDLPDILGQIGITRRHPDPATPGEATRPARTERTLRRCPILQPHHTAHAWHPSTAAKHQHSPWFAQIPAALSAPRPQPHPDPDLSTGRARFLRPQTLPTQRPGRHFFHRQRAPQHRPAP